MALCASRAITRDMPRYDADARVLRRRAPRDVILRAMVMRRAACRREFALRYALRAD